MATPSRTRSDEWSLMGPGMTFSDQELICAHKGKNSAFGRSIVRSGRAEWDIELNFQTYGGITVGVFRTKSSATGNDDNPEYVSSLPLEGAFTDSETGYGYTNRTGKFVTGGSSQEYGAPWENGDVITIRLDLTSSTLSFSKNGDDQGSVQTPIARGAYRLAAKMQFSDQKITIKRFWTSLMDEGNQAENSVLDQIHDMEAEAKAQEMMAEETKEDIDDDDDESYNSLPFQPGGTVDGAELSSHRSVQLENGVAPSELRRMSLDDLRSEIEHQRRSVTDVPPEIEVVQAEVKFTPQRPIPEQIKLTKTEESTDIFLMAGKNLKTDTQSVTCVRGGDNEHSAFGAQVVTRGMMEWVLKIEAGRNIVVGISANTLGWDSSFTDFVGSYGYGDDGYKYSEGNIDEYSDSFVPGDHIIIRLDMDERTLTFAKEPGDTNQPSKDCGTAFSELPLDYDSGRRSSIELREARAENGELAAITPEHIDEGAITGYRLAVSMIHRNSKISIVSSSQSHTQQYSPRYGSESEAMTFANDVHNRKTSWNSMQNAVDQRPEKVLMPGTPSSSTGNPSVDGNASEISHLEELSDDEPEPEVPTIFVPDEKEVNGVDEDADDSDVKDNPSTSTPERSPRQEPSKPSPRNGGRGRGRDTRNGMSPSARGGRSGRGGRGGRGGGRGDRGGRGRGTRGARSARDTTRARGRDQNLPRKEPRRRDKSPNAKLDSRRQMQGGRARATDARQPSSRRSPRRTAGRTRKPGPAMDDNDEETGPVRFVKTAQTDDRWFKSGPKIRLERTTASCRQDAPSGQSAFGHLVLETGRVKWDVRMDAGEHFAIGISSSTEAIRKFFPQTMTGYGYYSSDGGVMNNGNYQSYGDAYRAGDVVSVKLDAVHHTLSFSKNGADQGVAFRNIPAGPYRLAVMIYNRRHTVSIKRVTVWEAQYS